MTWVAGAVEPVVCDFHPSPLAPNSKLICASRHQEGSGSTDEEQQLSLESKDELLDDDLSASFGQSSTPPPSFMAEDEDTVSAADLVLEEEEVEEEEEEEEEVDPEAEMRKAREAQLREDTDKVVSLLKGCGVTLQTRPLKALARAFVTGGGIIDDA